MREIEAVAPHRYHFARFLAKPPQQRGPHHAAMARNPDPLSTEEIDGPIVIHLPDSAQIHR